MGTPGGGQISKFWLNMTPKNFNMISTFGVIFGQHLCICHPMVPIYAVPPNCYAFDVEDITSGFNLYVFFFVQLLLCVI